MLVVPRQLLGCLLGLTCLVASDDAAAQWRDDATVVRSHGHVSVVEQRQSWNGVSVLGRTVHVINVDGTQRLSSGERVGVDVTLTTPSSPPRLSALEVRERLGEAVKGTLELRLRVVGSRLRWTWVFDPPADRQTLERRRVFVDDATAEVSAGPSLTRYVDVAAFDRNPVLDEAAEVFDVTSLSEPVRTLRSEQFDVRQCEAPPEGLSCVFAPVAPTDAGDFVFTAPDVSEPSDNVDPTDLFAAASVYVHAERLAMFAQAHQLALPCSGADGPAVLLANYRAFSGDGDILIGNAAYTGDCSVLAVFGQGPGADWGYDGDVVYHELTHGLIDAVRGPDDPLSRLNLREDAVSSDAGAIAEAVSDFVAAVVSGDPGHAEYVAEYGGGQGRSVDNALRCPEGLSGEVHGDSEILAGALWDAYVELGDPLVDVVFDAVAVLRGDASFEDASRTLVDVADAELGAGAAETLRAALAARGLDDCPRVVGIEHIRGELWLTPPGPRGRFEPMRPPPFQLALEPPAGSNRAHIEFDTTVFPDPGWSPIADIDVIVRAAEPIIFEYMLIADTHHVDAEITAHIHDADEGSVELEVVGGQTSYAAFFNRGIHIARLENFVISYSTVPEPPEGSTGEGTTAATSEQSTGPGDSGDASTTADPSTGPGTSGPAQDVQLDDDGGCSCRESGPGPGWLGLWCLGLLSLRARSRGARPHTRSGCRR